MEREITVDISKVTDVTNFCNIANKYEAQIMACSGPWRVNSKSLLGLFSLDLSKPINVRIIADSEEEIESFVSEVSFLI